MEICFQDIQREKLIEIKIKKKKSNNWFAIKTNLRFI